MTMIAAAHVSPGTPIILGEWRRPGEHRAGTPTRSRRGTVRAVNAWTVAHGLVELTVEQHETRRDAYNFYRRTYFSMPASTLIEVRS